MDTRRCDNDVISEEQINVQHLNKYLEELLAERFAEQSKTVELLRSEVAELKEDLERERGARVRLEARLEEVQQELSQRVDSKVAGGLHHVWDDMIQVLEKQETALKKELQKSKEVAPERKMFGESVQRGVAKHERQYTPFANSTITSTRVMRGDPSNAATLPEFISRVIAKEGCVVSWKQISSKDGAIYGESGDVFRGVAHIAEYSQSARIKYLIYKLEGIVFHGKCEWDKVHLDADEVDVWVAPMNSKPDAPPKKIQRFSTVFEEEAIEEGTRVTFKLKTRHTSYLFAYEVAQMK